MLVFLRQAVVGYAEQRLDRYFDADFLACFPCGTFLEGL